MSIRFISFEFLSLLILFIVALICWLTIFLVNRVVKILENDLKPSSATININELKNSEYLTFIITYLVPFMGINMDLRLIIALFGFFIFLGLIYLRTSLFCINPLLNLIWEYNIYEMTIGQKKSYMLTKCHLPNGQHDLNVLKLNEEVYLGVKNG